MSHFEPFDFAQDRLREAESRHGTKWRAPKGNLILNRFLHFGPLRDPPVEMTKAQILITIGIISQGIEGL